jgi:hypothetical protein
MSRKKWEKLEEEYAEAMLFQDTLKKLQFESIGEFVELVGGVMGMININDYDRAKKISEAFALRIGYILDKIGYVDKVIDKNKSMRDFYEEQQKRLIEQEKVKKEAEVQKEPSQEEKFAKEYDKYLETGEIQGEPTLKEVDVPPEQEEKIDNEIANIIGSFNGIGDVDKQEVVENQGTTIEPAMTIQLDPKLVGNLQESISAKHVGAGWYELSNGERIRGKNNLPDNVKIDE